MDLLDDVESLNFRFLDNNFKWHEQWPPADVLKSEFSIDSALSLKAVEVTLVVLEWGTFIRLFDVVETWNLKNDAEELL